MRPGRLGVGGDPSSMDLGHMWARLAGDPAGPATCRLHLAPMALWSRALQASISVVRSDFGARHLINVLFILLPSCGSWCL